MPDCCCWLLGLFCCCWCCFYCCWLLMPGLLAGWSCFEEIVISAPGCRLLSAIYTWREIKWDFYYSWDKDLTDTLFVSLTNLLSRYSEDKPVLVLYFLNVYIFLSQYWNWTPSHTHKHTYTLSETLCMKMKLLLKRRKALLIVFEPSNILPPGSDEDKKTRLSPLAASKREQETDSLQ